MAFKQIPLYIRVKDVLREIHWIFSHKIEASKCKISNLLPFLVQHDPSCPRLCWTMDIHTETTDWRWRVTERLNRYWHFHANWGKIIVLEIEIDPLFCRWGSPYSVAHQLDKMCEVCTSALFCSIQSCSNSRNVSQLFSFSDIGSHRSQGSDKSCMYYRSKFTGFYKEAPDFSCHEILCQGCFHIA